MSEKPKLYLAGSAVNRALFQIVHDWITIKWPHVEIVTTWYDRPESENPRDCGHDDMLELKEATHLLLIEPSRRNSSGEFSWALAKGIPVMTFHYPEWEEELLNMAHMGIVVDHIHALKHYLNDWFN